MKNQTTYTLKLSQVLLLFLWFPAYYPPLTFQVIVIISLSLEILKGISI